MKHLRHRFAEIAFCAAVIAGASAGTAPDGSDAVEPRIVGGQEAVRGAWPWMAALVYRDTTDLYDGQFCGGALVHPSWVVTAAHCTEGETASTIDVVVGAHNLQTDTVYQRRHVVQIRRHSAFNQAAELDSDIALLKLDSPVTGVTPLEVIDDSTLAAPGVVATILGWGSIDGAGTEFPAALRQAQVPVVALSVANAAGIYYGTLTANMLPAGYASGGVDSCVGDSGGPLVVRSEDGQRWMLAGITSFGRDDRDCAAPKNYGVYTRVSSFRAWIYQSIFPLYGAWETLTGVSGETRDPDHDGVTNWLEFLRGTPPRDGRQTFIESARVTLLNGDPVPTFTFRRRTGTTDVNYGVSFSSDGISWLPIDISSSTIGNPVPVPGVSAMEEVTIRGPAPLGAGPATGLFRMTARGPLK
jgi:secreted trypsin-like serine protease